MTVTRLVSSTAGRKWHVGLACDARTREQTVTGRALGRLGAFADVDWHEFENSPSSYTTPGPYDSGMERELSDFAAGLDALIISKGCPRVTSTVLGVATKLRLVGDIQGDRFGRRVDVEAARSRDIRVVDTTQGSSDPVAEWALGLILVGLRNAGSLFRRLVAGELLYPNRMDFRSDPGYLFGELTGKTVGLIGCGYIGRRLLEFLKPFRCPVLINDPFVPRVIADIYDVTLTSLEHVMAADVVVCLVPLTSATRGMIGKEAIELIRPNSVFVNVSRGPIVDSDALVERLARGDIVACLDVFDPEPIPQDSVVRRLPNVFLTPHIAGVTAACGPRFFDYMVDEVARCFAGHETRHDLVPRE